MTRTLDDHFFGTGPKRILALDGGGIRGVLTLEILAEIEKTVGSPLSDYFDLIGGTSTGSIIAAGLARGWDVARLRKLYHRLGESIFEKSWLRWGLLRAKFPERPLQEALDEALGDVRLGDDDLKTGLAIMAKRVDTHSPWIIHNNPRGKYFDRRPGSSATPNKSYPVSKIVRASTAAPHFFNPERIQVADDVVGTFVDGGVSPHNNPSLQLVLLATLQGYGLRWPLGEDKLLVVSVGTGSWATTLDPDQAEDRAAASNAFASLLSMMDDASALNELMLQWLSNSPTARQIDREVGDLSEDLLGGRALLRYVRYDAPLEGDWLRSHLPGWELSDDEVDHLRKMDKAENIKLLAKVGEAAAKEHVRAEHFPSVFDIR
jgi:hypothetical protein